MSNELWLVLPPQNEAIWKTNNARSFLKLKNPVTPVNWFQYDTYQSVYMKHHTKLTIFIPPNIRGRNNIKTLEEQLCGLFRENELESLEFSWVDANGDRYKNGVSSEAPQEFYLPSPKWAELNFRIITFNNCPIFPEKGDTMATGCYPETQQVPLSSKTEGVFLVGGKTKTLKLMTHSKASALDRIIVPSGGDELNRIEIHGPGRVRIKELMEESAIILKIYDGANLRRAVNLRHREPDPRSSVATEETGMEIEPNGSASSAPPIGSSADSSQMDYLEIAIDASTVLPRRPPEYCCLGCC
jgi:hypothetical protein